ncbi:MAG: hypothetical protein NTY72_11565 [Bacteroidetes bacterium]|nr:hypothetical protein [Bacteroidota bacterium]
MQLISNQLIRDHFVTAKNENKFTKVIEYEGNYLFNTFLNSKRIKEVLNAIQISNLEIENFNNEAEFVFAQLVDFKEPIIHTDFTTFIFIKKDGETKIYLKIKILYYSSGFSESGRMQDIIKSKKILSNAKMLFLLEGDDTIECNKCNNHYYEHESIFMYEVLLIEIDLPSFKRLINASKVKANLIVKNNIIGETELENWQLVNLKGYYNSIFDENFEADMLTEMIKKRMEENE